MNQHSQALLLRTPLQAFSLQPLFVLGIALMQVSNLALGFVELQEVGIGSPLKTVKVPLDDIPSLQHINHTTQLGEGALNCTIHITDKDIKQHLTCEEHHFSPVKHRSNDNHSEGNFN